MNLRRIEKLISEGKELDSEQEEFLLKKMDDYWEHHPDVINRFPRWRKYIAWVAGYQLFDYNKISKKIVEVPLTRQHKLIFNKLRPYVRTLLSKLASEAPTMSIIPNTTEDDDVRAARIGDKVIEGLSDKLNFIQELNNVKLWIIICNRAYMRVSWNDEGSGVVGYSPVRRTETEEEGAASGTMEPTLPDEGGEEPHAEEPLMPGGPLEATTEEGELSIKCVPPFNCRVDPLYWDRSDWRWFLFGSEVDARELESEYDLEADTLHEKGNVHETAYQLDLQDEQDIMIGAPDKREDIAGRTVVLKELWTPKIWVFAAGDKVLDYGINEYNEIPFFAFEDRIIPIDTYQREFQYNESMIKDIIPVQRELNRMYSIQSIALDRASKLKIMVPLGSVLSKRQWTNDYGTFIDYNNRMGEPHQMKLEPFPMEINVYKSDLTREMESILSLSPVSFGQLPERASHASGTLVNILLEQDDVILNPLLNHINDVIQHVWTLAMRIVQDNYTVQRLIKFVGEDGQEDVVKFQGADLKGNTDVRVTSQSGLPRSRALRIEYIMKLREVGLLKDDRATLEMLEFGNAEKVFKDNLLHEKKAYRENVIIMRSPNIQQSMMYPLDDHMLHTQIHLRLRLGAEFDKLNPVSQQLLDQHIMEHQQAMMPPPMPPGQEGAPGQAPTEEPQGPPPGPPTGPPPGQ